MRVSQCTDVGSVAMEVLNNLRVLHMFCYVVISLLFQSQCIGYNNAICSEPFLHFCRNASANRMSVSQCSDVASVGRSV